MTSRILIADDHEMVGRGIRSILESWPDVEVSEARDVPPERFVGLWQDRR
jgi:DNA-binding NarL/FixJ family response regulator